ncbi:bifunctional nicotinamidase/pyrazinamidase [Agrobacterium rubi]|uniref:Nicotinamidase n=1 Tax=Agrobacterium rubi TaxID=28099 RepID=A0AAE7UQA9_9HYPH|nr:bifunctional nicotinamidase/pyrazinamidase [Agrobacterium rubi]NTE86793.1 bifunctional nicotinamidase/pyrazinamidase [Agrobacterium rubi]NTF02727.1 bifunctional nicotinamidase/pyrazinamidase [Agrobacterium rubi]NTF36971.1 bifunctional nicotinamidase/pyrazinamidase [Agrobacterium rubi]OCJ55429.1 nicotinamidase [Agrobacterium rubi]QTF99409.1 bifunctional nicotinamidase/pyrazinamidase [Agrobacterium rubi]
MKALLLIDIQNGFCPGGHLAVADGDKIVPIANALIENGGYDLIVASQDWHPANHGSFASQHPGKQPFEMGELSGKPQVLWPDHCVQETPDAEFHPDLNTDAFDYVQQKGENPAVDSYSAFRDNDQFATTGLADYLERQGVTVLDVCGLATDYCVSFSAMDAVEMLPDVKVRFIEDASRGIDPEGIRKAIAAMRAKGVAVVNSSDILND